VGAALLARGAALMLTKSDWDFLRKPRYQPIDLSPGNGAPARKLLGLKPGESVTVRAGFCKAMRTVAYGRSIPCKTKKLGNGLCVFERLA
jgi:hypothetical protein